MLPKLLTEVGNKQLPKTPVASSKCSLGRFSPRPKFRLYEAKAVLPPPDDGSTIDRGVMRNVVGLRIATLRLTTVKSPAGAHVRRLAGQASLASKQTL